MNATPIKVLVIDDEPPIRKLLRMGLSTQGYDILEASNGKLALEKLDGDPVIGSGQEEVLLEAGFSRGPRKLTLAAR